jgi:hypothetical protein
MRRLGWGTPDRIRPMTHPLDRAKLIEAYGSGVARVLEAWMAVPAQARRYRPAPGEWSPHELVIHLADADVNGYVRFRKLVAEPGAEVAGYAQDAWASTLDYHQQDPVLAIELMTRLRAVTHPILSSLTEDVWNHTVTHSERGNWTMAEWLSTYTNHIDVHLAQMDEAVAAWQSSDQR